MANQNIQSLMNYKWTFTENFIFRLCFVFFIVYIFPFPLNAIPFSNELLSLNQKIAGWYYAVLDSYYGIWHRFVSFDGLTYPYQELNLSSYNPGSGTEIINTSNKTPIDWLQGSIFYYMIYSSRFIPHSTTFIKSFLFRLSPLL